MAHTQQFDFMKRVKKTFPQYFKSKRILDVGSYDVNGNNKFLFDECQYYGLDLDSGPNVDIVADAHTFEAPNEAYDVVISGEMLEHNKYWPGTLRNMIRMLKSGGLMVFACATVGRPVHGIKASIPHNDPNWKTFPTSYIDDPEWNNYYRNISIDDIRNTVHLDEHFIHYSLEIENDHHDLYFWGIKR